MLKRVPSPIGARLRRVRMLAGISARELDRQANITAGHTSLIETRVENVSATTLAKLAGALGVSIDWLVTGEGPDPTKESVRDDIRAATERAGKHRAVSARKAG